MKELHRALALLLLSSPACISAPKDHYRQVGINWTPESVQPWKGLHEAVDAANDVLRREYPANQIDNLMDVWIDVVPFNGVVRSVYFPDGCIWSKGPDGKQVCGKLNGSIEKRDKCGLGLCLQRVLIVRQLQDAKGVVLPVDHSAVLHELAEHSIPFELGKGLNSEHAKEWQDFRAKMDAQYKILIKTSSAASAVRTSSASETPFEVVEPSNF